MKKSNRATPKPRLKPRPEQYVTCPSCAGHQVEPVLIPDATKNRGFRLGLQPCWACEGTGNVPDEGTTCPVCADPTVGGVCVGCSRFDLAPMTIDD